MTRRGTEEAEYEEEEKEEEDEKDVEEKKQEEEVEVEGKEGRVSGIKYSFSNNFNR